MMWTRAAVWCFMAAGVAGSAGCASKAPVATTAQAPDAWSAVQALRLGTAVIVEPVGRNPIAGHTRFVDARFIELDTRAGRHVVDRRDVSRVLVTRSRSSRAAVKGAAVGGLGGVLQGLLLTKSNRWQFAALFGAGWATIGGVVGAVSGTGQSETTVIYMAPGPGGASPTPPRVRARRRASALSP